MPVEEINILAALAQTRAICTASTRRSAVLAWNAGDTPPLRGLAITPVKFGISFTATLFNQAGAPGAYTDGSVLGNHGGTEMGQGPEHQGGADRGDELGVACLSGVQCTASDTSKVPNARPPAASSGTDLTAAPPSLPARNIRDNLAAFGAGWMAVAPGAIRFGHAR